jgi:hypothetical protein
MVEGFSILFGFCEAKGLSDNVWLLLLQLLLTRADYNEDVEYSNQKSHS